MQSRNKHLDISRGIGIIAVVFIHASGLYISDNINCFINLFHNLSYFSVPLFIIVAGFLHQTANNNIHDSPVSIIHYLHRRFLRLIVPYFLFSVVYIVIRICIEHFPIAENFLPIRFNHFGAIFSALFMIKGNPAGQLYFLPLLFFVTAVFKITEILFVKKQILLVLCLSISFISYGLWGDIYLSINPLKGIGFYAIGYFLYTQRHFKPLSSILMIIVTGSLVLLTIFLPKSSFLLFFKHSFGSLFVFFLSFVVSQSFKLKKLMKPIIYIGKKSFSIYLLHEPYIVTISYSILVKVLNIQPFLACITIFFIGIIIPLVIDNSIFSKSMFLSKWFLGKSSRQINYSLRRKVI